MPQSTRVHTFSYPLRLTCPKRCTLTLTPLISGNCFLSSIWLYYTCNCIQYIFSKIYIFTCVHVRCIQRKTGITYISFNKKCIVNTSINLRNGNPTQNVNSSIKLKAKYLLRTDITNILSKLSLYKFRWNII